MKQEQIIRMQALEQEANALNQQLQLIEQNLLEIKDLGLGLDEIGKKDNKNILVNIGKKIYLPVEIKENEFFVEIGKGNFVKKTNPEAKKIIKEQIEKLALGKEEITKRLDELQQQANDLMQIFIEKSQKEKEEDKKEEKADKK